MSRQIYRTELEIISDILEVLMQKGMDGEYISYIVRNANLSHQVAMNKCQKLIKAGLVTISRGEKSHVFVITEDGLKFYQTLRNFEELVCGLRRQ